MNKSMLSLALGAVLGSCLPVTSAWSACSEDLAAQSIKSSRSSIKTVGAQDDAAATDADAAPPMVQLTQLTREVLKRSNQVGASRLLADASSDDIIEARGGELPRVTFGSAIGPSMLGSTGQGTSTKLQASGGFNFSGVLYDGGRTAQLTQWRRELASASRFSYEATREQVVLEAISAALERSRYRQQAQVYQQYVRKMSCLVEALTQIVAEDKGRASELVQARKTQMQAELSRDTAVSMGRQAEIRLRKLVGDQLPLGDAFSVALAQTMDPGEVMRLMSQAGEVQQLRAQADASDRYAKAVEAGTRPQVSWTASAGGNARGDVKSVSVQAGISVAYTIFDGQAGQAAAAAAAKRATATRQQYEEILRSRSSRVSEIHDAAVAAFDRAKRYIEVLKDSDRVRNATFQQWSQLGKRSLFDVMSSESDHFNLRVAYVNALHDGYEANSQLRSLGGGLTDWLGVKGVEP